jgi:hypothetical protein
MERRLKFILWALPFLGLALGYAYAYLFFHGLLEIWHFVGKPEENIVQIVDVTDTRDLFVATETGKIFSIAFADAGEMTLSFPLVWNKEDHVSGEPVPSIKYYGADIFTLPPLFEVVQLYQVEYIYDVEGKGAVKFGLDADGNLWMWEHQIAGLTGLVLYFYPVIGFLAGLFAILVIKGIYWFHLKSKIGLTAA